MHSCSTLKVTHTFTYIHTYLCRANDEQRQTTKSPNANGIHAGAGAGPLESSPSFRVPRSHLPCLLVTENTNGRGLREQEELAAAMAMAMSMALFCRSGLSPRSVNNR